MIPKIIHYCWFGTKKQPKLVQDCIRSWKTHLPDFEIKCWTEENLPFKHPFVEAALKNRKFAFASDYARLAIIKLYGGIYLDTDMWVLKTFDDFLSYDIVLGYESPGVIAFGIIGAISNHPVIDSFINFYDNNQFDPELPPMIPVVLTDAYFKIKDKSQLANNKIFAPDYFYPKPFAAKNEANDKYITQNTYAVHLWNHSWRNEIYMILNREYWQAFFKIIDSVIHNKQERFNPVYYLNIARAVKRSIKVNPKNQ